MEVTFPLKITVDVGDDILGADDISNLAAVVAKHIKYGYELSENPVHYNEHTDQYYDITNVQWPPDHQRGLMSTTYGINSLPDSGWEAFIKATPTRMCRISGPCTIYTLEGPIDMPAGWEGWLAIDSKGHPYPIDNEVHASTYTHIEE